MVGADRGNGMLPVPANGGEVGNAAIEAPYYMAAYQQALANHVSPPAPLLEALDAIKAAAAAAPGEWQAWYWICIGGVVVFIATIFVMRGRWSPAAARQTRRRTTRLWHTSFTPCKAAKK